MNACMSVGVRVRERVWLCYESVIWQKMFEVYFMLTSKYM